MILSMTGFAVVSRDLPTGSLQLELRAVNHRYLDLSMRLPDELRALEPPLREKLGGKLARGKVECRLVFNRSAPEARSLALNAPLVAQLHALSKQIADTAPGTAPLSAAEILRWPGVVVEPATAFEELARAVDQLAETALADLTATRAREGAKLAAMIEERLAGMTELVARVAPRMPIIQAAYQEKLLARLREAALDADEERLRQELALFAAKTDVAEELSRLTAHISEVRRVLKAGGNAGKRLDFLMQELNREANTLGSKSVDAELSQVAVELKVLIEQMREQVQNLE
ncbi:MAG: YicC family protein [Burkholderiales bacterium]|nr:MAG: YicC family protein [Burkholderiales bacterium]